MMRVRRHFGFVAVVNCALAALVVAVLAAFAPAAAAADKAVFDYVVLIDVSGSMVGLPAGSGHTVIFPQVQRAVSDFVLDLPDGSNLTLIPFSGPIDDAAVQAFPGIDDTGRQNAVSAIDTLEATGQVTWLYSAIDRGLTELAQMRQGDTRAHIQSLLVYTDAEGNGPEDLTLDALLARIDAERADQEHLYVKYISLAAPVENAAALEAHDIDVRQDPAGVVSPFFQVQVAPAALDLGALPASGQFPATLEFQASAPEVAGAPIAVAVTGVLPGGATLRLDTSTLSVAERQAITFTLDTSRQPLDAGVYHLDLQLASENPALLIAPATIPVTFTVAALEPTPTQVPPTPTPEPVVGVPSSIDLGSQPVNLDAESPAEELHFAADIPVELSGLGAQAQVSVATVDASALGPGSPVTVTLGAGPQGGPAFTLTGAHAVIPIRADVAASALEDLDAGAHIVTGVLQVRVPAGSLAIGGQPAGSEASIPFRFVIDGRHPLNVHALLLAVLAVALAALVVGALPRLPRDAILADVSLRRVQRKRPLGLLLGGPVTLGGSRLSLGLEQPLARVRGRWFWPKGATVQALGDGVAINGEPLPASHRIPLRTGDEVSLAGRVFRYGREPEGQPAEAGGLPAAPRRARFGRRAAANQVDLDQFADGLY